MRGQSLEQVAADVHRVCRGTSGAVAIERAVAERLQHAVPFDAWCALTFDPASVLPTGGFHEQGVPAQRLPDLVQIEARGEDVMAFPALARQNGRVQTLSATTRGRLDSSQRYRDVLAPSGLEHEMRVAFTTPVGLWGALVFFRGGDAVDFSAAEGALVEAATTGVAAAIRREMVLTEISRNDIADGPGLLLLDAALCPVTVTAAAARWLDHIDDGRDPQRQLPYAVMTLAARASSQQRTPAHALRSRIRTRAGRWITMHAERLDGDAAHVSIIIEPTRPVEIAQLVADAYHLTARERDIVRLMAAGHSRGEIATLLTISPHTVDDHVKRVYGKLQVRSRAELTARLFFDQHAPRIHDDVPVGGTGWFLK